MKNIIAICLAAISAVGCSDDSGFLFNDADAGAELDSAEQELIVQAAVGAGNRFLSGYTFGTTPPNASCIYPSMGPNVLCILPPANKVVRIKANSGGLQNARTTAVNALMQASNLGGSGWTLSACDGCADRELDLTSSATAGSTLQPAFDTRRYLTFGVNQNANLTESPATNGVFSTAFRTTVNVNTSRLDADCLVAFPGPMNQGVYAQCLLQGLQHLATQGILASVGVGADLLLGGVTNIRDNYSSFDMTPTQTAKTYLSAGQKCRTRNYGPANFQPTVFAPSVSSNCSND